MSYRTVEECRWSSAIDNSAFGVWDLNPRLDLVHYSPQWKARLGFPRIHAPDSSAFWRCRVHPDDVRPMMESIRHHIDGSSPTYEMQFRLRSNGAGYRPMLSRGRVVARDGSGHVTRMVGTMLDLKGVPAAMRSHGLVAEQIVPIPTPVPPSPFHAVFATQRHPADRRHPPDDEPGPSAVARSEERRRLTDLVGDLLDIAWRETHAAR